MNPTEVVVNFHTLQLLEDVNWQLTSIFNQTLIFCTSVKSTRVVDCLAQWVSNHALDRNIVDKGQLPLRPSLKLDDLVS